MQEPSITQSPASPTQAGQYFQIPLYSGRVAGAPDTSEHVSYQQLAASGDNKGANYV